MAQTRSEKPTAHIMPPCNRQSVSHAQDRWQGRLLQGLEQQGDRVLHNKVEAGRVQDGALRQKEALPGPAHPLLSSGGWQGLLFYQGVQDYGRAGAPQARNESAGAPQREANHCQNHLLPLSIMHQPHTQPMHTDATPHKPFLCPYRVVDPGTCRAAGVKAPGAARRDDVLGALGGILQLTP